VPLILTEGLDIKELSLSARDQQLLESRQWQVIDITRAFGVPPHMIGETTNASSFGTGIEHMGIGFQIYTTGPHTKRWQQELNYKLVPWGSNRIIEFDQRALLQSDHKGRAEYYKAALGGTQNPAWMTPNEVRKLENLPQDDRFEQPATMKSGTEPTEVSENETTNQPNQE
jgi:HK97 family phage portal protein